MKAIYMACAGLLVGAFMLVSSPSLAGPGSWRDWEHGPGGYDRAKSRAIRNHQPMVLYFHTDWCGWCGRLNDEYLLNRHVREVLRHFARVEVNPEISAEERQLFKQYGGRGFPSFYVLLPAADLAPRKISPFRKNDRLNTFEFADLLEDTARQQLTRWGRQLYEQRELEEALQVFDSSLLLSPDDYYAHYMKGMIYHTQGGEQRDTGLLGNAREAYQAALRLNGSHDVSRRNLQQVEEMLARLQ